MKATEKRARKNITDLYIETDKNREKIREITNHTEMDGMTGGSFAQRLLKTEKTITNATRNLSYLH